MKRAIPLVSLSYFLLASSMVSAQHCAPIANSYLSEISVKHHRKDRAIDIKLEYSKNGGSQKEKYQIYLLAYLEKNQNRVPPPRPADIIDKQAVCVLDTRTIKMNDDGRYEFTLQIGMNDLAKKIIELGHLSENDREAPGGWGHYKDTFRLAVFIPFLEDKTYAILDDLPEYKHECNYNDERALLFQQLPYSFTICYGVVNGSLLPTNDDYYIEINYSDREKDQRR